MAQGIALPELNFCVVNQSNLDLQDAMSGYFGTGTASPVTISEGQGRNKGSFDFGQSLERDLIELMKDCRCMRNALQDLQRKPKKGQA